MSNNHSHTVSYLIMCMQKIIFYIGVTLFVLHPFHASTQSGASVLKKERETFQKEKDLFLRDLKAISIDSTIIHPIAGYFDSEFNKIYSSIAKDGSLPVMEREKAIRSMVFFMKELGKNLETQKVEVYDIPGAVQSYKSILQALVYHKPLTPTMMSLGARRSQLMAAAFTQYSEHPILDDIAVYKRVASSPDFILPFLENKPGFRYADSLMLVAAAHDPLKIVYYLNNDKQGIQQKIRNTNNTYIKQIVSLAGEKSASEILPFITQIANNGMNPDTILKRRTDVVDYYQLLVNTLQEARRSKDSTSIFLQPLRNAIKQKSLMFFINQVNDLHNESDAVRFASVKGLRPEDLYYIITTGGEEMYTSSYLGLYKRLMEHFKNQSADSLFVRVNYDNFRTFMRLAANYNVLPDFLGKMPQDKMVSLLRKFISGIEGDTETGLEIAMDIGDSFTALGSSSELTPIIQSELQAHVKKSRANQQFLALRLYGILTEVFEMIRQGGNLNKLWATLGNYEVLKRQALENKSGEVVEMVLFYGDEDGVASFNNFLKQYGDQKKWEISKTSSWVNIRSKSEKPVIIFANLPLDSKGELDLKAQDSLVEHLRQNSLHPSVLIHRGHSYHLDKTLKRFTPSVKLAFLGSCGGYNKAISIASINPDVQVIGSKKMGVKQINDPIIEEINETLLTQNDILWPELWNKLSGRFSKDEAALSLFNEYIPPSKNISLFVLKLFIYYNKFV